MTKVELITRIATDASLSRRQAQQVLAGFLGQIQAALRSGEPVRLVGFGTFAVRWRGARRGRHPRTGQEIVIAARKRPTFRAGKRLREAVQPPRPVVLVPYDPAWPVTFERLRDVYAGALGHLARAIEHVGSTAVPGLAATPIIDVDVVIPSRDVLAEVIRRLAGLGYRHQGDLGVPGREAFAPEGGTRCRGTAPAGVGRCISFTSAPRTAMHCVDTCDFETGSAPTPAIWPHTTG
jgi:nucleoid DNA-binding protein